ncbi:hypothetical protein E6C67_14275 [Azospirillum sp. TSA2s]|uniref:hypothetical protein n=1 Tax=Azospirillum sp. TSA2s TaxID=709810 RepID=UPI0010A9F4EB|nr:hypothetical protein [Azospirillum sp. TSA2s]QCG94994.1 hypothetical protein E6C67_14275 [Azospirillum sp. TSA2s]
MTTANTAPGLELAASVARNRAKLIRKTTRTGSAAAIAYDDLATELERMAAREKAREQQTDMLEDAR